jgi:phosphate transport system substrate-binding protein
LAAPSRACAVIAAGLAGLLFAAFFSAGCARTHDTAIIVAGSTSVQPFAEILAEAYTHDHPNVVIDVQGGGSSAGIMAAQSGTAAIGMSSRFLKDSEKSLWSLEIAKDGLALIVHPDNPVADLTLDQVRAIYAGVIRNWSEVGGPKAEIHMITREEGSGTRSAFESLVMAGTEINPKSLVQDSNGAVRQLVADDPAAVGFISLGLVNDKVKALTLGGIAATRAHIIDGSYTLSRPFFFVSRSEPAGDVLAFVDFVRSSAGRRILEAEGLITSGEGIVP